MIQEAEKILGFKLNISQGCYSTGVAASAGTHDGGGAFDFSVSIWDRIRSRLRRRRKIDRVITALRTVGFAAWYRSSKDGPWSPHIHAVAVGCPDLAPLARDQVAALRRGENGLASHLRDPHANLHLPVVSWEEYLAKRDGKKHDGGDGVVKMTRMLEHHKFGSRTLREGMSGTDVKTLQRKLGKARCGTPDGHFGPQTTAGVKSWQKEYGLRPSGVVGPAMWAKLR